MADIPGKPLAEASHMAPTAAGVQAVGLRGKVRGCGGFLKGIVINTALRSFLSHAEKRRGKPEDVILTHSYTGHFHPTAASSLFPTIKQRLYEPLFC